MSTLLSIPQVAERLGTTERHIRGLVYGRKIPFIKVGALVRFEPGSIETWLEELTVQAVSSS